MTSDLTPLLTEMLQQMREVLTRDDIRAGLPALPDEAADVSPLYAQWLTLYKELTRQQQAIAELDADIHAMEPWGDYPMSQIDQLLRQHLSLQFWCCSASHFEAHRTEWSDAYSAALVSQSKGISYFTTTTPIDGNLSLPGCDRCKVTPSPLSTLIMLQTRIKDTYRQKLVEVGDFALSHYLEVEAALGLHDTLPETSKRKRFVQHLKRALRIS